jgi:hypothetical protein
LRSSMTRCTDCRLSLSCDIWFVPSACDTPAVNCLPSLPPDSFLCCATCRHEAEADAGAD